MASFSKEFKTLSYVIGKSSRILLVAHSNPDGDTTGSVLAFKEYIFSLGKHVDITCQDEFPAFLESLTEERFKRPEDVSPETYDAIIGCDSVERGFHEIVKGIPQTVVTAILDHHPDITIEADIKILDPKKSSVCEIVYDFFVSIEAEITRKMATYLMLGILSDTGNLQHANTTTKVMEISSELMKKGASFSKIIESTFSNKKMSTLKLWGIAFEKAKINPKNGMIATVLTKQDIEQCNASTEDIGQVASILNTVPGTKFSLILSEREGGQVKGSLRSEEYKGVDVSEIAHKFGGGGHKLASGFTVRGKIVETRDGWEIQ
ncbi:MAG: MgpA protein [Candidatus Moranbacteria bacterium GW2011_GWC2_45_10]|nr:MAG: MgpA protein [Candidatus Moranbacteria bacterium GW2011_GWC2_45_10]